MGFRPVDGCPLCCVGRVEHFYTRKDRSGEREFRRCRACDLVFVPRVHHLDVDGERERYLEHNNHPDDPDYRAFLSRLFDELRPHLDPGSSGLDYGAGPGPALAAMLGEAGFRVAIYDPIFFPDESVLAERYDFITCTETAEHFRDPGTQFGRLNGLLRSPGWLGVMTAMLDDWSGFPDWYYHRDPTHISFYSQRTMRWIAEQYGWEPAFPRPNVVIFRKP